MKYLFFILFFIILSCSPKYVGPKPIKRHDTTPAISGLGQKTDFYGNEEKREIINKPQESNFKSSTLNDHELADIERYKLQCDVNAKSKSCWKLIELYEKDNDGPNAKTVLQHMCDLNQERACKYVRDKYKLKSSHDLAAFLYPANIHNGFKFEKSGLYFGQYFFAVQKTQNGYLIEPDTRIFRPDGYGGPDYGFLETKLKIGQGQRFCVWVYWDGYFEYKALNGFEKSIPRFKVYSGETPTPENKFDEDRCRLK